MNRMKFSVGILVWKLGNTVKESGIKNISISALRISDLHNKYMI